jgi:LuxR family maltose regulon positive regulatory protein
MAEGAERSLALICAPAGYGKTTLLAEWLSGLQGEQKVGWYSLDEADNDPIRFLNYLVSTLENACPAMGGEAHSLLSSFPAPPFQTILAILVNDL